MHSLLREQTDPSFLFSLSMFKLNNGTFKIQIQEPASKIWLSYIDLEKRACYSRIPPWEFHTQLQSKIQRVTGGFAGGLKRLTSVGSSAGNGSKAKKEEVKVELSNLPQTIVEQATLNHVAIVRDVVEAHYKNRSESPLVKLF